MIYYYEPNFIEKFFLGSVLFQIFAEIYLTQIENRSFDRHFETVFFFYCFA